MMAEPAVLETIRSPLREKHLAAGAKLTMYHGAEIPVSFGDARLEYQAVRAATGLFDFSFRSKFTLTGEHRVRFLHRIVSNNIQVLSPGQGTYATLLNAQGRILADLRIYLDDERIWVDTDADLADKAATTLRRYIIGDRVQIEPSDLTTLSFQGPASRAAIEAILGRDLTPLAADMDHCAVQYGGRSGRVVRLSSTGEEGYEVWLDLAEVSGFWTAALREGGTVSVIPCGSEALEILRIEAGIPRYGCDIAEDTLPLEAGLLNALSFNKGCYIGQEIVERARSRGHVNWKLKGVRFEAGAAVPSPGEALNRDGKAVGEITSSCDSPAFCRPIALAYVRREAAEEGTPLHLVSGETGEVTDLPFRKPSVPNV